MNNEATIQALERLAAAKRGDVLWRNNVGVLLDARGVPVRFGLANDSAAVNESIKSADLIGIRRVVITPEMVGRTIGQFYSREVKAEGWVFRGTPREVAQLRWVELVTKYGGDAAFTHRIGDGLIDGAVNKRQTARHGLPTPPRSLV